MGIEPPLNSMIESLLRYGHGMNLHVNNLSFKQADFNPEPSHIISHPHLQNPTVDNIIAKTPCAINEISLGGQSTPPASPELSEVKRSEGRALR
jgi:hypothetical protein